MVGPAVRPNRISLIAVKNALIQRRAPLGDWSYPGVDSALLERLYRARGVKSDELDYRAQRLLPVGSLKGIAEGAHLVSDAIMSGATVAVVADFDNDGASAAAVVMSALRRFGAQDCFYLVPDRITMGYGLSPLLVDMAAENGAELIITVDNGISAHEAGRHANEMGMCLVITDHHDCPDQLPCADAIINPKQPECGFESKNLAGVGVAFYLMLAVQRALSGAGWFEGSPPSLTDLLMFVALGTIGDMVPLDYNNRILVELGLRQIRLGRAPPGLSALMEVAGIEAQRITAEDCAFRLVSRVNAAGRLESARQGIDCLLSDSDDEAKALAAALDEVNKRRRDAQAEMVAAVEDTLPPPTGVSLVVFNSEWHQGLIGLVCGRLKDRWSRPTIAFTQAGEGTLKGSCRSIPGFHIRDAIALVSQRLPGTVIAHGGHAAASGLTIKASDLEAFQAEFEAVAARSIPPTDLAGRVDTDGELSPEELNLETAKLLTESGPWGQGFPAPQFEGSFKVLKADLIGTDATHVRYEVEAHGLRLKVLDFGGFERLHPPGRVLNMVYRPSVNVWKGRTSMDLHVVAMTE